MNVDKADIKIFTAHEIGVRLDDLLESNTKEMHRLEGGVLQLKRAADSVSALMKVVDQEMDEGKFDLEQAKTIKRFVERAHQMVTNLMIQTDNNRIIWQGRLQGFEASVEAVKKFQDAESKKVEALRAALAAKKAALVDGEHEMVDADAGRPDGVRPAMTIKQRRLLEEAEEKAREAAQAEMATKEESAESAEPAEASETAEVIEPAEGEESVLPRRRGRPRKNAS
jgi:arginyl-tRNA synthetase